MWAAFGGRDVLLSLKQVLASGPGPTVLHECRRCGTTLDSDDEACPACGSTGIASYEI